MIKIVKVRKAHYCDACGGIIKKNNKAILHSYKNHSRQKWPYRFYYHYIDNIDPIKAMTWSHGEFRARVCILHPSWESLQSNDEDP